MASQNELAPNLVRIEKRRRIHGGVGIVVFRLTDTGFASQSLCQVVSIESDHEVEKLFDLEAILPFYKQSEKSR
jgi:hypothetical protein